MNKKHPPKFNKNADSNFVRIKIYFSSLAKVLDFWDWNKNWLLKACKFCFI